MGIILREEHERHDFNMELSVTSQSARERHRLSDPARLSDLPGQNPACPEIVRFHRTRRAFILMAVAVRVLAECDFDRRKGNIFCHSPILCR